MQSPTPDLLELRVYGLNIGITTEALGEFLGKGVRVRGILLHPPAKGAFQWAQVWVATEAEVMSLLALREVLAINGITISRFGRAPSVTPPQTSWDLVSQLARLSRPASSTGFTGGLTGFNLPSFGARDPASSLPRNLYVLNLPLDLTQFEFKDMFGPHGAVEHSILLSQLDGMGRRRGFALMSSHCEALEVLHQMHGKWIDGFKLDVSWALVQRETKSMPNNTLPNRVVHPPTVPTRREPSTDCVVILDNLDGILFPDTDTISSIFSQTFGAIYRVVKLSDSPLTVMIQFENQVSAMTLINANGLRFGERTLSARGLGGSGGMVTTDQTAPLVRSSFDPFGDVGMMWPDTDTLAHPQMSATTPSHLFVSRTNTTRLSAESQPFVPTFQLKSEPAPTPATALEFDMGLAKNMFDKANLMMSKISSISGGPLTPERTHPADLSAGSLSAKSHRSDTTVVGEE